MKKGWGIPGGLPRNGPIEVEQIITYENFREAIKPFNYRWQTYNVTTRDGYKLSMFRITGPIAKSDPDYYVVPSNESDSDIDEPLPKRKENGKSVLMIHGHNMDSGVWFAEKNMGKPLPL